MKHHIRNGRRLHIPARITGILIVAIVQRSRRDIKPKAQDPNPVVKRDVCSLFRCRLLTPTSFPGVLRAERVKSEPIDRMICAERAVRIYSEPRLVEESAGNPAAGPGVNVVRAKEFALFANLERSRIRRTWNTQQRDRKKRIVSAGVIFCVKEIDYTTALVLPTAAD